jgi:diguanylate cyclase (GGDEF)-like protein
MSTWRLRAVATAGAGLWAVLAGWLVGGWGGEFATRVADDLGLLLFASFAAGCCFVAAAGARAGRERWSWMALGAGLVAWSAGEVAWCCYEIVRRLPQTPFPSWADAGYLLFPVGAGAALMLFPTGRAHQSRSRLLLDGVVASGSLFVVSWVTVLGRVYRAGGGDGFVLGVSLAYPAADLALVTMTVLVLARAHTAHRVPLGLMAAGVTLMSFSDSWFAYLTATDPYQTGDLIDLGWVGAFVLFALAALSSTGGGTSRGHDRDAPEPTVAPSRAWLPYLPLLLACVVGVDRALPVLRSGPVPLVGAVVVISLLARQFVTVADNHRLLRTIAHQAFHDPLTGLANRALFADRLNRAVELQRRELRPLGVLVIDLDDFKAINDRYGHHCGDELLIRVAERLNACLRPTDTVARLGGDEFAVLIEDESDVTALAGQRIRAAFEPAFVLDGRSLTVSASIGMATAVGHSHAVTPEALLRAADLAMYGSKRDRVPAAPNDQPTAEGSHPPRRPITPGGSRRG